MGDEWRVFYILSASGGVFYLLSLRDQKTGILFALVERSEGYSGSDIRLVCKEAAMQPLRRLVHTLESREQVTEDG
jgi:SpoVK/Ycf46/Vps4 family AAA+-type ATPase